MSSKCDAPVNTIGVMAQVQRLWGEVCVKVDTFVAERHSPHTSKKSHLLAMQHRVVCIARFPV